MAYHWREDRRQKTWLWVGLLFFVFYFTEAVLFWGPQPRVLAPPYIPLIFWGLFGMAVIGVTTRPFPSAGKPERLETIQAWLLGTTITAAAIGSAFLIIRRTGDITLGHVVLLFILAQAGLIIGALSVNLGWLAAGLCWLAGGVWVLCQPSLQDYALGATVAFGFVLIGLLRMCWVSEGTGSAKGPA